LAISNRSRRESPLSDEQSTAYADFTQVSPDSSDLNRKPDALRKASHGDSPSAPITEDKIWRAGAELLGTAHASRCELPLIFGYYAPLTYWAVAREINVGEKRTTYRFASLRELAGGFRRSDLVHAGDLKPLSDDFIRSYAIVKTPYFIGNSWYDGSGPALLLKAISFAADKHRLQKRKDAEASPYINHPIAVAAVLAAEGDVKDETILLAAALHDTVEDTQTTFQEIKDNFGTEVAELVREVTDNKSLDKAERKRLQIEHAPMSSFGAKQLKVADKICNVRDVTSNPPVTWLLQRRREYLTWSERVVAGCRGANPKLDQAFDQAISRAWKALDH
jgi:guanosine-3',5'-bis(diphosphate) 3'-pyrophosphohydrolase